MACLERQDCSTPLLGLHTPAMVADLVRVDVALVRRWHRRGLLAPVCDVHKLPYFDFEQVTVARELADLLSAGMSPPQLETQLAEWRKRSTDARQSAKRFLVASRGKRLLLRCDDSLVGPDGQCWFEFADENRSRTPPSAQTATDRETVLPFVDRDDVVSSASPEALLELAEEMEDRGELAGAIDLYRAALAAGGPNPEASFALAEALYRSGDLAAARERYYVVLELDEKYVEARANLGCLLAEMGELELAVAARRGGSPLSPRLRRCTFSPGADIGDRRPSGRGRRTLACLCSLGAR